MFVKRCVLVLAMAAVPTVADCADQVFFGYLSGANESPLPIASAGNGLALVTYTPTTHMMRVQVNFADLTSNTSASHIHCCISPPTTTTAIVAITTPYFPAFPLGVTSGTYDHTFDMTLASSYNPAFVTAQGGISVALDAILAGMANSTAYLNIHTTSSPAGEIRANMRPDAIFAGGFEQASG